MSKVILTVLLISNLPTFALDKISVSAFVDKTTVSIGDPFRYTINISGETEVHNITFPTMTAFKVMPGPSGTSQSIAYVNGKLSQSKKITYLIIPKKVGTHVIPSLNIKVQGNAYTVSPITITVVKKVDASQKSSQLNPQGRQKKTHQNNKISHNSKDIFIKPTIEKQRLFVGEGSTVSYNLYSKISILRYEQIDDIKPEGFWIEKFPIGSSVKVRTEYIDGYVYNVATINKIRVFPTRSGKLKISPHVAVCEVLESDVRRRQGLLFDEFSALFSLGGRTIKIKVPCPTVFFQVDPLPKPHPKHFTGAVGQFSLNASLDKKEIKTGNFTTLHIEIRGEGNVKTIGNTVLDLPSELKAREPIVKKTSAIKGNVIEGRLSEDILIEPQVPGKFGLGKIKMSYFDTKKKKFIELSSKELVLNVSSDPNMYPGNTFSQYPTQQGTDIAFIKTTTRTLQKDTIKPMYKLPTFYIALSLPLFAFLGLLVLKRREDKFRNNTAYRRRHFASYEAKKRLKKAKKHLKDQNTKAFFSEIETAIMKHLGDTYLQDTLAMTKEEAVSFMKQVHIENSIIQKYVQILEASEFHRYAPTSGDSINLEDIFLDAEEVISKTSKRT